MWACCPFRPILSPCRAGHPKLPGVLAGRACTGLGHRDGAQMPGRCAVPHVCGSAWGGLGSPAVGRFMPLAGSFAKVALPSVSSEHWGEARTELCMGFVGSGLPGHADTTGQAGLCWRPEAVSPGPVLTALSRTSGAALSAACTHTRSPGRSPAPGPPGPALGPGVSSVDPPLPPRATRPGFPCV